MSKKHNFSNAADDEMEQQKKKAQKTEQQETAKRRRWLQWLLWGSVFIGATTTIVIASIATGGAILPVVGAGIGISVGLGVAVTAVSFAVTQAVRKVLNLVRNLRSSAKKEKITDRLKGSPRFTKLKEPLLTGSEHKGPSADFTQFSAKPTQRQSEKEKEGFLKRAWSSIKGLFGFKEAKRQRVSHARINRRLSGLGGEDNNRDLVILANKNHEGQNINNQHGVTNDRKRNSSIKNNNEADKKKSTYSAKLEECIEKHTRYMDSLKNNLAKLNDQNLVVRNAAQKERKGLLVNLSQFMPIFIQQIKAESQKLSTEAEKKSFYRKMTRFFHTDHYETHLQAQELADYKLHFIAYEKMRNEVSANGYSDKHSSDLWRENGVLWWRLYKEWVYAQMKYQDKWLEYLRINKINADYSTLKGPFMELQELHEAELRCIEALLIKKNTPGFIKAAGIGIEIAQGVEDSLRMTKFLFRIIFNEVEEARFKQEKKEQEEAAERERERQQEAKRQEELAKKLQGKGNDKAHDVSYETLSSSSSQESFASDSTHITDEEIQEHVSVSDKHGCMFHEHHIEEDLLGETGSSERFGKK